MLSDVVEIVHSWTCRRVTGPINSSTRAVLSHSDSEVSVPETGTREWNSAERKGSFRAHELR